jgi:hypothetical protein
MAGIKTAAFLLGLLVDSFDKDAADAQRIHDNWKLRFEEFESELPEPAERTVEQWESYIEMTGERYYSMAAQAHSYSASRHVRALSEAFQEQM